MLRILFASAYMLLFMIDGVAQKKAQQNSGLVYVDKKGIMRWTATNREAAFFGVNYTVPFAYGYRSHKALGVDIEKAITQDVYHFARLGLDVFRVHVWDTEITDTLGNLLENDHLRLYDYLINELKKRNIKIIFTPIAFRGNGYPERDEKTPGFSNKYGKQKALVNEDAIKAQENYFRQVLKHVNPYTKLTYVEDPDVIALEINNEPHHSGAKEKTLEYVNRMVAAARSEDWKKPVFYNISESPTYADAVAKANIEGVSFQWYPTGLVAGYTLKGNYLPNVDRYTIPFDTIPGYATKARLVYEFDAGDVLQSCMYPAMARSFRTAGFQCATQFAYDPVATAYGNTEYQTHYLNLAYTPSKAISLLIASKAFHAIPRMKNYGVYPADTLFDGFRVSYLESLSELNADQEFYYSNSTQTKPLNAAKLQHIAGVGTSSIVNYSGSGAYFLDRLEEGVWRLELMPDAIPISDPFEKASPRKEVTRVSWTTQTMTLQIPDLGTGFAIKGINNGNGYSTVATGNCFRVSPGTYIIARNGKENNEWDPAAKTGAIQLQEFFAPKPVHSEVFVSHNPFAEVSQGKSFLLSAKVAGVDTTDNISVQIGKLYGPSKILSMIRRSIYDYEVEVPAELCTPGLLQYRLIVQKGKDSYFVYPGNQNRNPFAWDSYEDETWKTFVAHETGKLEIFNATKDRRINVYPPFRRNYQVSFIASEEPGELALKLYTSAFTNEHTMGFHFYFGDRVGGRISEIGSFDKLVLRARTENPNGIRGKVLLITKNGSSFSVGIVLSKDLRTIEIPILEFQPDSSLLLPRPYPGFLPLWFKSDSPAPLKLEDAERLGVYIGSELQPSELNQPHSLEIQSVWLQKKI